MEARSGSARRPSGKCRIKTAAVSQILHAGEAAWKDERDLRREGIELLGWAQFAPRAHLPFADHVHDFDSG